MTRILRPSFAIVAATLMLLLVATLVLAETRLLDGKLRAGDTVTVPASELVADDLYVFAGTATIDGSVDGDLLAFGGQVHVNGDISGDLIVAGGNVDVAGSVTGDVRAAGGQMNVTGSVTEDLVMTGGQVTLASSGTVGGDLIVSGGNVSVAGTVTGAIEASAGSYNRSGPLPGGGEHVSQAPSGPAQQPRAGNLVLDALRQFVVLLILGGLAIWLVPRALRTSDQTLRTEPLLSLGSGIATAFGYLVFCIATVLLVVLLAIAFGLLQVAALAAIVVVTGFLAIGVVSFAIFLAVAFFADLVVGLTLGRLAASGPLTSRWQELAVLAAGVAVVVLVTSLPVVGGLAKLLVIAFGLGAMALAAWHRWRGRPPGAQQATIPAPAPEAT
jgi:cytoskeletal protein CcmA (bactofilin family)